MQLCCLAVNRLATCRTVVRVETMPVLFTPIVLEQSAGNEDATHSYGFKFREQWSKASATRAAGIGYLGRCVCQTGITGLMRNDSSVPALS